MKNVRCGADCAKELLDKLKKARIGLITNDAARCADGTAVSEMLLRRGGLTALFAPEHGISLSSQAGEKLGDTFREDVPVYSLYGSVTAPTDEMLEGIDVLIADLQDVGARFYTYLYTVTRSMKAVARANIPFIVFDRPNMVSCRIEGELLDEKYASFVGEYAVPTRYGLTVGEFARYINEKKHIGADLTTVCCEGYNGNMYFDDTGLDFYKPSPNIVSPEAALVYSATCIFESVLNVSEGRGTDSPFSLVGAPFIDKNALCRQMSSFGLDGVCFTPERFTPCSSKHAGTECGGIRIKVTDKRRFSPFKCCVFLFDTLRRDYPLEISESTNIRLFGTRRLLDGASPEALILQAAETSRSFAREAEGFRLYGWED
ncbi:MAG TPA: DUF1343 domain-containing protein [Bacillota bacterium]|nr:DUF1343 domain-containing protein [Bacillota bacterium]